MKHLGLFEGIGGFSLAARWMGWDTVVWCEKEPFCQRVLRHHFPEAAGHGDIKTTDFKPYNGTVDIITGGFPCQPYSTAGKRLGKEDDRHLWPEMLRAIREVSPRWIVGENVRGFTNWNDGVVFDEVQAELEAEGYEVLPFLLPAAGVGAPHRRDRIWIVAHASHNGSNGWKAGSTKSTGWVQANQPSGDQKVWGEPGRHSDILADTQGERRGEAGSGIGRPEERIAGYGSERITSNPDSLIGREGRLHQAGPDAAERHAGPFYSRHGRGDWKDFPTQPPIRGRDDGLPTRLDGITVSAHRNGSIKAYGNAIVPQVAFQIFQAIQQYES